MKIALADNLNKQRVYTFWILLFTAVMPAFPIFNTQNVSYLAYLLLYTTFIYGLTILERLTSYKKVYIDALTVFMVYMTLNASFIREIKDLGVDYMIIGLPLTILTFYVNLLNTSSYNAFLSIIKGLAIMALVQSGLGISQVFFGVPYFENLVGEELHTFNRNYFAYFIPGLSKETILASGTFQHFNTLAGFLVLTVPITYTLWKTQENKFWKFVFLVNAFGVITTFSRGSLMATTIGLSFLIIRNSDSPLKFLKFAILIPPIIIGFMLIQDTLVQYVDDTENASPRFNTWVYSIEHALKRPANLVFGYGSLYLKDILLAKEVALNKVLTNVHNSHLQLFIELGLVGTIIFYFGFYHLVKDMLKDRNPWSNCIIAVIIAFFISQIFDNVLFAYDGFIFFSLVGLFKSKVYLKYATHSNPSSQPDQLHP
jgi:hypothetical protein